MDADNLPYRAGCMCPFCVGRRGVTDSPIPAPLTEDALAAARAEGRKEGERAAATRAVLLCLVVADSQSSDERGYTEAVSTAMNIARQIARHEHGLDLDAIEAAHRRAQRESSKRWQEHYAAQQVARESAPR